MNYLGPSLRDRLRTGTRLSQDALEHAQGRFDLLLPESRAAFFAAQRIASDALRIRAPELAPDIEAAIVLLDEDLLKSGYDMLAATPSGPRDDDEMARGYVWHSQQVSLRMRARRLPAEITAGSLFLSAPRDPAPWRRLCAHLEAAPGHGAAADTALNAANDWFALWESIHLTQARDST